MGGYIETIYRMKELGNGKGNYFTIEGDMEEIPDNTNYLEIREVYLEKLTKLPSKLIKTYFLFPVLYNSIFKSSLTL